jgi:TetR/AcrR family tetracycline transcriptional repressor
VSASSTRADAPVRDGGPVTADRILAVAGDIVERHGVDALTMRRLSEDLGVAVTSIYWHVGNRDAVLDGLIDRLLDRMETIRAEGDAPVERTASLARQLRCTLLERQHLVGLAHERDRTPAMFLPVQQAMAIELAAVGLHGEGAATLLRALQVHVISSVLMDRAAARNASHGQVDRTLWPTDHPDRELVDALARPADYEIVFEFGLTALLSSVSAH